jgi:hypothetical protein
MIQATARGHTDRDIYGKPVIFRSWPVRKTHVEWCWEQTGLIYNEDLHLRALSALRDPQFQFKETA